MQKGIIKNVNKLTGEAIDAKDLASMLSGIIGNESGVLTVFDELRLEKISDNKVRLHSGVYSLKGHILYIPKGSYEDFEIESGTLGANRIDLLVAEYVKNGEGDGEDVLGFRVIKGESTSGSPHPPNLIQQDINENGITRQEPLYELRLSGLQLGSNAKHNKIVSSLKLNDEVEKAKTRIDNLEKTNTSSRWARLNDFVHYKIKDDVVMLRGGSVGRWELQAGKYTKIGTLGRSLRPSTELYFPVQVFSNETVDAFMRINTSGDAEVYMKGSGTSYWGFSIMYFVGL